MTRDEIEGIREGNEQYLYGEEAEHMIHYLLDELEKYQDGLEVYANKNNWKVSLHSYFDCATDIKFHEYYNESPWGLAQYVLEGNKVYREVRY